MLKAAVSTVIQGHLCRCTCQTLLFSNLQELVPQKNTVKRGSLLLVKYSSLSVHWSAFAFLEQSMFMMRRSDYGEDFLCDPWRWNLHFASRVWSLFQWLSSVVGNFPTTRKRRWFNCKAGREGGANSVCSCNGLRRTLFFCFFMGGGGEASSTTTMTHTRLSAEAALLLPPHGSKNCRHKKCQKLVQLGIRELFSPKWFQMHHEDIWMAGTQANSPHAYVTWRQVMWSYHQTVRRLFPITTLQANTSHCSSIYSIYHQLQEQEGFVSEKAERPHPITWYRHVTM